MKRFDSVEAEAKYLQLIAACWHLTMRLAIKWNRPQQALFCQGASAELSRRVRQLRGIE